MDHTDSNPDTGTTETRTCPRHGEYESVYYALGNGTWSECPECVQSLSMQNEFREQQLKVDIEGWLERADIPLRFKDATFENYVCRSERQRAICEQTKSYAENIRKHRKTGTSMIMTGDVGTGKTHLAIAVAKYAITQQHVAAKYTGLEKLLLRVKSTFGKGSSESQIGIINEMRSYSLLIIDEIGVQHKTDFERQVMFDVVNARYEDMKPTILISNLDIHTITECIGDRVVDRLRENGGISLVFKWDSHRRAS
ncbi:ATP-binding protein [Hahella ganghwensis]|uniref:ATP-binding protein n=1 Tax=Hahella ganghwensis TaxID=286420 RepID=UPI00037D9280|nr:ATP-binding protein [Hahella ganghwensis]